MRASEVFKLTGVTRKALRGYEELGLVAPTREANGYRTYDEHDVRVVREIRELNSLGIPLRAMRPFDDCLNGGSEYADACPATLAEYRRAIEQVDQALAVLSSRRTALVENLTTASERLVAAARESDAANPNLTLPAGLPEPIDDGAADHLPGRRLPGLVLPSTDGEPVDLGSLTGRVLIYVFPMTGVPGRDMPDGWDSIPGARGCTSQNCDMRDHYAELVQAGVDRVLGLSSQPLAYQHQVAEALRLPYPLLTDEGLDLAEDPGLPTFTVGDLTLYRRQALVLVDGVVEHVFHPVFPPDKHAETVLRWIRGHVAAGATPGSLG